ncbi:hypothetical protein LTR10_000239 [Elasticomyces elasticus]|nr:hypothetical protein LTR10_000239 [Elasticomyces elasticus]
MDLLQSVRKSGSRGGVNFSWDEVKNSAHRENYLGHSLKAPVGRWQSKKDLAWYAKGDDAELTPEEKAAKEAEARKEELRKVKEAEHDAMLKAMGLPVPDRENANLQPLGLGKAEQAGVNRALKEALGDDVEAEEKAVAKLEPERRDRRRDHDDRDEERSSKHRRRSRSRSRDREHRHRHHRHRDERSRSRDRKQHRSRSRDRKRRDDDDDDRRPARRHSQDLDEKPRVRDREERRQRDDGRDRERSRSPYRSRRRSER